MSSDKKIGDCLVHEMSQRRSFPRLESPAPSEALMNSIFTAALRAPDHMHLRPWRFLVISGSDRQFLGDLFAKDCLENNPHANLETIESARQKASRAPLIVVGIASYKDHQRVPKIEQTIATGCVLSNIGLAVYASGYGSVWRTGPYATSATVRQGLGVDSGEDILGYIYIGTPTKVDRPVKVLDKNDFFSQWPAKK
jgi:nitroreductase